MTLRNQSAGQAKNQSQRGHEVMQHRVWPATFFFGRLGSPKKPAATFPWRKTTKTQLGQIVLVSWLLLNNCVVMFVQNNLDPAENKLSLPARNQGNVGHKGGGSLTKGACLATVSCRLGWTSGKKRMATADD